MATFPQRAAPDDPDALARPSIESDRGRVMISLDWIERGPHAPAKLADLFQALDPRILERCWLAIVVDSASELPPHDGRSLPVGDMALCLNAVRKRVHRRKVQRIASDEPAAQAA